MLVQQSELSMINEAGASRLQNAYIPLTRMLLYPIDCLSIGYFARYVNGQTKNNMYLDLSCCIIGDVEIKALAQELCKPSLRHNVDLNIMGNHISINALRSLNMLFNYQSCLVGINVNYSLIEDIDLAGKYLIEGVGYKSWCKYLSLIACRFQPTIVFQLVLLLRCQFLKTLDLSCSGNLFANRKVMPFFCEALKYSKLTRLRLDDCSIDDDSLMLLAVPVCRNSATIVLDIDRNPYTEHGLTNFLRFLLKEVGVSLVLLTVLSVNHVSNIHHELAEMYDLRRNQVYGGAPKLVIGCMTDLVAQNERVMERVRGFSLLHTRPDLAYRSPHH